MVSYLGRLNYVFDQRYLVTISGRIDGSSRFGDNNRYGFFPSVGLGWNVSREDFWNTDGLVNRFKLRASWGQTGNDRITDFGFTALVVPNINTVFGVDEVLLPGATLQTLANPDLRWEETTQFDFGVELGVLDDRLQLEADWYRRVANGVLFAAPIPDYIGANAPVRNIGSILNRGVDLELSWRDRAGAFNYSLGTNMSFVYNEVLALDGMQSDFFAGESALAANSEPTPGPVSKPAPSGAMSWTAFSRTKRNSASSPSWAISKPATSASATRTATASSRPTTIRWCSARRFRI